MKFDKSRFLRLLKLEKDLGKSGIYHENYSKYSLLSSYRALLENYTLWQHRNEYAKILTLFVEKKIDFDSFLRQFSDLYSTNLSSYEAIVRKLEEAVSTNSNFSSITIDYNPQSKGFGIILADLADFFEVYDPNLELDDHLNDSTSVVFGMCDQLFRENIESDYLPKIRSYLH